MGNIPIHPMIVHFPIVFAILLPVAAMIALFLIRKQTKPMRAWVIPFAISLILLATGVAGLRTGEAQLERGKAAIPLQVVAEHRQAAHRFIVVAAAVALVAAAGLAPGCTGRVARRVATAGAFVVVVSVFQVGQAGAELAYHLNAESIASNP